MVVEAHAPRLTVRVDEARQKPRASDADLTPGELARDHGEAVLFVQALLAAREAERGEGAGDHEEDCDEPHRPRIGTGPDGLEVQKRRAGTVRRVATVGPVALVPYEPDWPRRFEAERALLERVLAPWLEEGIHHVGSTAIPGIAAKPVIDMIAGVRDFEEARRRLNRSARSVRPHTAPRRGSLTTSRSRPLGCRRHSTASISPSPGAIFGVSDSRSGMRSAAMPSLPRSMRP